MATQIRIFVKHEDLPYDAGETTIGSVVSLTEWDHEDAETFNNGVQFAVGEGCENVAETYIVDYDSLQGANKYIDRINKTVAQMTVERIEFIGEKQTYAVRLANGDDGEIAVEVPGATPVEAAFRARWAKAGDPGALSSGDLGAFIASLKGIKILSVEPVVSSTPTP